VFYIFFFIQVVNLDTEAFDQKIVQLKGIDKFVYEFFSHCSAFTEIFFREKVEIMYFIRHPACNYLTETEKKSILENVD
jgi:hypothetical protein